MKFLNKSKNTIYLGDIDKNIPYTKEKPQEISINEVKKSPNFRLLISLGQIEIIDAGNSLFERNIMKMQKTSKNKKKNKEKTNTKESSKDQIEVKIRGHFYEAGGYAKANRNLVYGLNRQGIKTEIDVTNKNANDLNEQELRELRNKSQKVGRNAIIIDAMIPTFSQLTGGRYKILLTTVEAGSVPNQFVEVAKNYNEIWVTSNFCKEVLKQYDLEQPIFVMPNSINTDVYHENYEPINFNPPLNDFVFLSVFGWSYRKGYDVLLKAYLNEFENTDPVSLLIVSRYICDTKRSDIVATTIKEYVNHHNKKNSPHISRLSTTIPEKMMPNLYKAANAFVLFTRGEGFGYPFIEASLCGTPVIATNHSGHTMFLNKENSILVDVDEIKPMERGKMQVHYWDDQLFPKLTSQTFISDAQKSMRYAFNYYNKSLNKNKKLQTTIKNEYNIEIISKRAKKRLEEIWRKIS